VDYAAFLQAAQRGQPPPLALLHGPDEQLLDDALELLLKGLFTDASEVALGREVLEGGEVSVETVVRSAMTLPFMTSRRLVIVRRAQALNAKGAETLTAYARDPNPSTCLLLLADEGLAASRERRSDHWLLGAVPAAAVVTLPQRSGRGLTDWLKQRAAAEDLVVTDDAARLLVQWVGEDGVEAVVILAIDDMKETDKYEKFLRPILERLKQIDDRAPVSIMTCKIDICIAQFFNQFVYIFRQVFFIITIFKLARFSNTRQVWCDDGKMFGKYRHYSGPHKPVLPKARTGSISKSTPPSSPPKAPPSGPPLSTYFSCLKLTTPFPPSPACTITSTLSTNILYRLQSSNRSV